MTATRRLRDRGNATPVLALTTFDDDEVLAGMLRAGAAGFILKGIPAEDLQRAVRVVAVGGAWLDPGVTARKGVEVTGFSDARAHACAFTPSVPMTDWSPSCRFLVPALEGPYRGRIGIWRDLVPCGWRRQMRCRDERWHPHRCGRGS